MTQGASPLRQRGPHGTRRSPSADLVQGRGAGARRPARGHARRERARVHARLRERPSRVLRAMAGGPAGPPRVLADSGRMTPATTVSVPGVRGPAATAKILAAIDVPSGGRLLVGVGPGSSARDYELVGVGFEERWKRL